MYPVQYILPTYVYRSLLLPEYTNWPIVVETHHIVNIFPIVQSNQLECGQHGPQEVIETGVAMVRIFADAKASVSEWTMSASGYISTKQWIVRSRSNQPVAWIICPAENSKVINFHCIVKWNDYSFIWKSWKM